MHSGKGAKRGPAKGMSDLKKRSLDVSKRTLDDLKAEENWYEKSVRCGITMTPEAEIRRMSTQAFHVVASHDDHMVQGNLSRRPKTAVNGNKHTQMQSPFRLFLVRLFVNPFKLFNLHDDTLSMRFGHCAGPDLEALEHKLRLRAVFDLLLHCFCRQQHFCTPTVLSGNLKPEIPFHSNSLCHNRKMISV